ncbi:MAG: PH domain-containing protein [Alteromonadaceae bacterium]|nr:PH domain-containing protein [Alteromonadaceae bacterium]
MIEQTNLEKTSSEQISLGETISEQTISEQTISEKTISEQTWQRISPIALVYFAINVIKNLLGNFVYFIPALIAGYSHIKENPTLWLPIFLIVLALLIIGIFLSFYFFQYRLNKEHIEIRSGVFAKKHLNLPFTRIQNIKLEQPIYYRPFNTICMVLDTAGSIKQEAKIVALDIDFAEHLKAQILTSNQNQSTIKKDTATSNSQINIAEEKILNQRSLSDLIIHGLSNNRVWIFLGGLAPFFDNIARAVGNGLTSIGINTDQLFSIADKSWWQISLYALSLTFLIFLPITLFSVFGSILSFYNYTLSKMDDKYIRRSGLLTKHEVTMKLSRLQMVIRQQDWLDILLKRINLKFEQNQSTGQNFQAGAYNSKIIVPSITEKECQALINDVYPHNNLTKIKFIAISKRYLLRYLAYMLLPCYLFISTIALYNSKWLAFTWLTIVFTLIAFLIVMRWYRWGYAMDEHYIYVRKGALGVDYLCFERFKVQQTKFKQSIFLRRHQLCKIQLILASGTVNIPYMKEKSGYQLINECLYQVEKTHRSWM